MTQSTFFPANTFLPSGNSGLICTLILCPVFREYYIFGGFLSLAASFFLLAQCRFSAPFIDSAVFFFPAFLTNINSPGSFLRNHQIWHMTIFKLNFHLGFLFYSRWLCTRPVACYTFATASGLFYPRNHIPAPPVYCREGDGGGRHIVGGYLARKWA